MTNNINKAAFHNTARRILDDNARRNTSPINRNVTVTQHDIENDNVPEYNSTANLGTGDFPRFPLSHNGNDTLWLYKVVFAPGRFHGGIIDFIEDDNAMDALYNSNTDTDNCDTIIKMQKAAADRIVDKIKHTYKYSEK